MSELSISLFFSASVCLWMCCVNANFISVPGPLPSLQLHLNLHVHPGIWYWWSSIYTCRSMSRPCISLVHLLRSGSSWFAATAVDVLLGYMHLMMAFQTMFGIKSCVECINLALSYLSVAKRIEAGDWGRPVIYNYILGRVFKWPFGELFASFESIRSAPVTGDINISNRWPARLNSLFVCAVQLACLLLHRLF